MPARRERERWHQRSNIFPLMVIFLGVHLVWVLLAKHAVKYKLRRKKDKCASIKLPFIAASSSYCCLSFSFSSCFQGYFVLPPLSVLLASFPSPASLHFAG
jgi:hypothetical protein